MPASALRAQETSSRDIQRVVRRPRFESARQVSIFSLLRRCSRPRFTARPPAQNPTPSSEPSPNSGRHWSATVRRRALVRAHEAAAARPTACRGGVAVAVCGSSWQAASGRRSDGTCSVQRPKSWSAARAAPVRLKVAEGITAAARAPAFRPPCPVMCSRA